MLFNSIDYLIFLPLVVVAFYLIPKRFRWILLLAASYFFYMFWRWEYVILLIISTMVDYVVAIKMSQALERKTRRMYLMISIATNLGLLFFFKYFNFFTENTVLFLEEFNIFVQYDFVQILLPVGISFYTFQTLSYTIDVYQRKAAAETHLGYFALYVSYFPQLVAGPIERSVRLIPQFKRNPKVTRDDIRYAINKILLGFFKKLVVADTLSLYVNSIYSNVEGTTGIQLYLGAFFFAIQLFCDFSGYTDIAIGSARLMGVRLMENFRRPLWSENHSEYWSKWHISLTSWIRDYVYVPLSKINRSPSARAVWAIVVLVLIGFWHGANWTFIFFGLLNGVVLITQRVLRNVPLFAMIRKNPVGNALQRLLNLNLLFLEAVYFRSVDVRMGNTVLYKIFTDFRLSVSEVLSLYKYEFLMSVVVSLMLLATVAFNKDLKFKHNWAYVTVTIAIIIVFGQDLKNQFIYFQF